MRLRSLLTSLSLPSPASGQPSISNSSPTVLTNNQLSVDQLSQLRSIANHLPPASSAASPTSRSQTSDNYTLTAPSPSSIVSHTQPTSQQFGATHTIPTQQHSAPSIITSMPVAPYQSIRTMGLPSARDGHPSVAASTVAEPSSQPFLGFNNLGVNMRGQVNQRRLASSAATALPSSQPRLPARGRRRGPAVHPPSLPRAAGARIEDCLLNVPEYHDNGVQVVGPLLRVKVKVYPPPVRNFSTHQMLIKYANSGLSQEMPHQSELLVYRFLRDSFNAKLEEFNLLYTYELPCSTSVTTLIQRVSSDMQSSSFNYQFTADTYGSHLAHERLPLQLLEFINRGVPRQQDGQVRLRRAIHGVQTIVDLAGDRARHAVLPVAIEGNCFVIHFGICYMCNSHEFCTNHLNI